MNSKIHKNEGNRYQMLLPVLISKNLKIKYGKLLKQKGFINITSSEQLAEDMYFDVVCDTYKDGFIQYKLNCEDKYRFHLNKTNCDKNDEPYTFINMKVENIYILIKKTNDSMIETDTIYFSISMLEDREQIGRDEKLIPKEAIIATLSQYTSDYLNDSTISSYIKTEKSKIQLFHGVKNKGAELDNRYQAIYDFFDIKRYNYDVCKKTSDKLKEKSSKNENWNDFKSKINFVNGNNIFINYYIRNENYFNQVKEVIEIDDNSKELDATGHTLLSNITGTKYESNVYVKDVKIVIHKTFFLKWKDAGTLYTVARNSFGAITNDRSPITSDIIFNIDYMAVFFALNQRVMNIELQESIKGVKLKKQKIKTNSYQMINEYYKNLEKFVFYEISADEHLNALFVMLQKRFINQELTTTIMSEMEIHQSRRLNDIFEKLTIYGIYLAVIGIIISIGSYCVAFIADSKSLPSNYQGIINISANPWGLIILGVVFLFGTFIYLIHLRKR